MTLLRLAAHAVHRRAFGTRGVAAPCSVVMGTLAMLALAPALSGQSGVESPVAPATTIGPVTSGATLSLLGLTAAPGNGASFAQRSDLWFGATQPLGQVGRVKLTAIGSGDWRPRDGVGGDAAAQGILALRARAQVGQQRVWSAVSYGYASANGSPASGLVGTNSISMGVPVSYDGFAPDTSISRRIDVGRISRAEAGMVSTWGGVELSVGMSVERATRATTQTITVSEADAFPVMTPSGTVQRVTSRTQRTFQRRDVATGLASMGFNTGSTSWLLAVSAPVAAWLTDDALAPKAATVPTIATLAVVQPVTGWLSLVGAAASHQATMGGAQFRDQVDLRRSHGLSPVVALGVRISRLHGDNNGTPGGILAFETRTLGAVDSISVEQGPTGDRAEGDTLRVVLLVDAPRAELVEIMGDATEWSVTAMRRNAAGRWRAELRLAPGVHRLIVRADRGKWVAPPGVPVSNDDYGSPVGMVVVKKRIENRE